jgi:esterase/lipase
MDLGTQEIDKKMIWLENSGHIVTKDLDPMKVFDSIFNFIQKIQDSSQ